MQDLDFAALLYLLKNWDGQASLPEYIHKFQETKQEIEAALKKEQSDALQRQIQDGGFSF